MSSGNFKPKRKAAASHGFLATARLSCWSYEPVLRRLADRMGKMRNMAYMMAAYSGVSLGFGARGHESKGVFFAGRQHSSKLALQTPVLATIGLSVRLSVRPSVTR